METGPEIGGRAARQQQILAELFRVGEVSVAQLCASLKASHATIRRELVFLEKNGRLRRTHGGAVAVEPLLYEPFRHDSTFRDQYDLRAEQKRRIGTAAGEMIDDDDTIILNPGTTTTQITRSIPARTGVTLITTTVNVAMELAQRKDLKVVVTGGVLRGSWFSLTGPSATASIQSMFPDKAFIGVNGIDAEKGLTGFHPEETAIAQLMIRQSRRKIVVADSNKIGRIATYQICPVHEIDVVITDTGASDEMIKPLLDRGVDVRRV